MFNFLMWTHIIVVINKESHTFYVLLNYSMEQTKPKSTNASSAGPASWLDCIDSLVGTAWRLLIKLRLDSSLGVIIWEINLHMYDVYQYASVYWFIKWETGSSTCFPILFFLHLHQRHYKGTGLPSFKASHASPLQFSHTL